MTRGPVSPSALAELVSLTRYPTQNVCKAHYIAPRCACHQYVPSLEERRLGVRNAKMSLARDNDSLVWPVQDDFVNKTLSRRNWALSNPVGTCVSFSQMVLDDTAEKWRQSIESYRL